MSTVCGQKKQAPPSPVVSGRWLLRLTLASVFGLLAVLAVRQVGSLDVGFHLRAAEYILSGNGWPRTDPFTYTVGDHEYIDTSWGYQVLLGVIQRGLGAPGLVLLHAGLALATFALVYRTTRLAPADPATLRLLLLLGVLSAELRYEARPELLSYCLLALVLYLLHRHAEEPLAPLWLLPPLFLVWANCHSLFILGWAALGCFVLGQGLRHRRVDRRLLAWAGASVAVTLINPYGFKTLVFPFTLATRLAKGNVFGQSIGEFISPFALGLTEQLPFHPRLPVYAFRALFVLVLLSLVPLLRRKRYSCAILALPFLYLSFKMVRNMPLLAVACLPGLGWGLSLSALWKRGRAGRQLERAVLSGIAVFTVLLGLRVYHDAYYIDTRRPDRFGLGWNRWTQPIDALAYVERAGLRGRVLNHLNFGGYLMWARPEPVFIDGRLEVIGERFFEYYRQALASPAALEAAVARYGVGWLIFPYKINDGLLRRLSADHRWHLVYFDHLAVIFVKDGEPTVEDPGLRREPPRAGALDLDSLPGLGNRPRRGGLARWLGGLVRRQEFPEETESRGLFHYFRGDPAQAAAWFAEAIGRSDGAYYETYNNLGSALYKLGRHADAARCYAVVLQDAPGNRLARQRLEGPAGDARPAPERLPPRDGPL